MLTSFLPGQEEGNVDFVVDNEFGAFVSDSDPTGIAEQVAGRRDRVQFEIVLDADVLDAVLSELREAFPVRDVIYWVLPIIRSGRLSDL